MPAHRGTHTTGSTRSRSHIRHNSPDARRSLSIHAPIVVPGLHPATRARSSEITDHAPERNVIAMRFNHITLFVSDLERSKAFYRTLGLVQIVDSPPRYARFRFPDGDATLSVEVLGDAPPATAHSTLYFECDALDETVAALKSHGLVFQLDPTDMSYLWREAHLRDPDGHELRLYTAGENRLNPPWKSADAAPAV